MRESCFGFVLWLECWEAQGASVSRTLRRRRTGLPGSLSGLRHKAVGLGFAPSGVGLALAGHAQRLRSCYQRVMC